MMIEVARVTLRLDKKVQRRGNLNNESKPNEHFLTSARVPNCPSYGVVWHIVQCDIIIVKNNVLQHKWH